MDTVAVFESREFRVLDAPDPPSGRDCAEHLMRALARNGCRFDVDQPVYGERAWFVYPLIGNRRYEVRVQWAVRLGSDDEAWAVQLSGKRGLIESLVRRGEAGDELDALASILRDVLAADEKEGVVSDVQWLTDDGFYRLYAC